MNGIKIFTNEQFGSVRVTMNESSEPVFCAKDVAMALGYSDTADAIKRHCKSGEKVFHPHVNGVGGTNIIYIPEKDVYRLIMRSNLQDAEKFQDWVCDEVLPSIRKHGAYMTGETLAQMLQNPDALIELLTALKTERERNIVLSMQNNENIRCLEAMKPKVAYYDTVLQSETLIQTDIIAARLGISAIKLNKFLCENRIQFKQGGTYVLYSDLRGKGFEGYKEYTYTDTVTGRIKSKPHMYWTERGAKFIICLYNMPAPKTLD